MNNILTFEDVTVRLGRRLALNGLSLSIKDRGNIVGLFGQNGAGKSTMMRVACGVINRYQGQVQLSSRVGYLPDSSFLYNFLTVGQSISMASSVFSDFDATIAERILASLGMNDSMRIGAASKGMLEQLHLGLVLARRCGLYIFDEPLAAVDPLTRDTMIGLIREYRQPHSTAIISTHLIGGLEDLFDEAIVIQDGKRILHENIRTSNNSGGLESRIKEVMTRNDLGR
jgi:ABC-2 type transport system ATP-binding protein